MFHSLNNYKPTIYRAISNADQSYQKMIGWTSIKSRTTKYSIRVTLTSSIMHMLYASFPQIFCNSARHLFFTCQGPAAVFISTRLRRFHFQWPTHSKYACGIIIDIIIGSLENGNVFPGTSLRTDPIIHGPLLGFKLPLILDGCSLLHFITATLIVH